MHSYRLCGGFTDPWAHSCPACPADLRPCAPSNIVLPSRRGKEWGGRRGSNSQPLVSQTSALTIELRPPSAEPMARLGCINPAMSKNFPASRNPVMPCSGTVRIFDIEKDPRSVQPAGVLFYGSRSWRFLSPVALASHHGPLTAPVREWQQIQRVKEGCDGTGRGSADHASCIAHDVCRRVHCGNFP